MTERLRVAGIQHKFLDWPNPEDGCVVIFFSGCKHNCPGCQSPDLQNFETGFGISVPNLIRVIKEELKRQRTDKLALSGGDPLYQGKLVNKFLEELKKECPEVQTIIYTGFEFEEVITVLSTFDYVKTGVYREDLKQQSGKTNDRMTLASTNQKIWTFDGKLLSKDGVIEFNNNLRKQNV